MNAPRCPECQQAYPPWRFCPACSPLPAPTPAPAAPEPAKAAVTAVQAATAPDWRPGRLVCDPGPYWQRPAPWLRKLARVGPAGWIARPVYLLRNYRGSRGLVLAIPDRRHGGHDGKLYREFGWQDRWLYEYAATDHNEGSNNDGNIS